MMYDNMKNEVQQLKYGIYTDERLVRMVFSMYMFLFNSTKYEYRSSVLLPFHLLVYIKILQATIDTI